ncbi:MAG TPA: hypothetical protein VIL98_12205 [Gaiellaceae bacterium]
MSAERSVHDGATQRVLVVDVSGSHIKVLVTGEQVPRRAESGPKLTAAQMVDIVKKLAHAGLLPTAQAWWSGSIEACEVRNLDLACKSAA